MTLGVHCSENKSNLDKKLIGSFNVLSGGGDELVSYGRDESSFYPALFCASGEVPRLSCGSGESGGVLTCRFALGQGAIRTLYVPNRASRPTAERYMPLLECPEPGTIISWCRWRLESQSMKRTRV